MKGRDSRRERVDGRHVEVDPVGQPCRLYPLPFLDVWGVRNGVQLREGGSLRLSVMGVVLVRLGVLGGVVVPLLLLLLPMRMMGMMPLGGGIAVPRHPRSGNCMLVGLCVL